MNLPSYLQPEKQRVRRLVLERAVAALTTERSTSSVVTADEFEETLDFALHLLQKHGFNGPLGQEAKAYAREWHSFYRCIVGRKASADLRVLYLCGPEPRNDLDVLLELGVDPHNIWAIESDRKEYNRAVAQLESNDLYIRIHHGTLESFFNATNEVFDIVYIDACGALPGGRPNTVRSPLLMFDRERLASLGVLVTNFSQPAEEKREEYERLFSYYFAFRYDDCPSVIFQAGADPETAHHDPGHLLPYIKQFFDETYSEFITRFLVDIGRSIVPLARIYDNRDLRRKYFASEEDLGSVVQRAMAGTPVPQPNEAPGDYLRRSLFSIGDIHLNSAGYPVLNFLLRTGDSEARSLIGSLLDYSQRNGPLMKAFENSTILATVLEGHWGAASGEMMLALQKSWMDKKGGFFCDIPFPHLLINSLFGIYGHPYLPNVRASTRLSYTGKKTKMYTDAIVFDQCRYYFDFLPTLDLIPRRFESWAYQLVLRACLDRMGRNDFSSSSHPFHGAALGCLGEFVSAKAFDFMDRGAGPSE